MKQIIGPHTIVTTKDASGEYGWAFEEMPYDEDHDMFIVMPDRVLPLAHDLMEHVNGFQNMGLEVDELMAFGAAYYTRVQHGVIDPHNTDLVMPLSPDESMAMDVGRACGTAIHNGTLSLEHLYRLGIEADAEIDESIDWLVRESEKHLGDEDAPENYYEVVSQYIQIGYDIAYDRYGSRDLGYDMIVALCDGLRDALRLAEDYINQLVVTIAWDIDTYQYGIKVELQRLDHDDGSDTYDEWLTDSIIGLNKEYIGAEE